MQLTLVSHYGPKPAPFAERILLFQSMLTAQLGDDFAPYALEQVHATIIGLEGTRRGPRIHNENFRRFRDQEQCIDFEGLLRFLRARSAPDWAVRLGGFDPVRDHGFTSGGEHPFTRSFALRGEIAVAMGWPYHSGAFVPALHELRRACQTLGALHKWHQRETDVDNDFFFVLGRVSPQTAPAQRDGAQQLIRAHLAAAPLLLPVSHDTFSFVAYLEAQLPPATSRVFRLNDDRVTAGVLEKIYAPSGNTSRPH